ncbi:QRFP-like peptide receptor [Montipora foliosa]|uniref:QRFP-like peptide receptor n=1 Tax=Montipora foliosa TaxID=591990 RepID=UPI0035F15FA1
MAGNMSMNNKTAPQVMCESPEDTPLETAWKTFSYSFIAFGSLLGNSFVIIVIFKNRSMRSTINYFIVNMASSDLLFTVFVIPRLISELYYEPGRWFVGGTFGSAVCKLDYFVQDISTAISIVSLVAIAFDRLHGVVFPMKAGLMDEGKVCKMVLTGTWFIVCLLHLHIFFAYKLSRKNNGLYCSFDWSLEAAKTTFVIFSTTLFFLPAVTLVAVYTIIIIRLWKTKFPGNQSKRQKQRIAKRNRNVLQMIVAVVIVFICCWLPVNVSIYLLLFHWSADTPCYTKTLFYWVILLAYSNGSINPFLYFIFNENFRQGFRKVFCHHKDGNIPGPLRSKSNSLTRRSRPDAGIHLGVLNAGRREKTQTSRTALKK